MKASLTPPSRAATPAQPPEIKAAALLRNRAVALLKAGRAVEAEAALKEAIRLFPGFAEAQIRIGNIRRERGDLDGALRRYRRALAIKPDYAWAHLELATCLQRSGKAEPALEHYRLAVRHNPKLYKTVLFTMVSQPSGCFWLDLAELKRQIAPEGDPR